MDSNDNLIEKAEIEVIIDTEILDPIEEVLYDYEVYDENSNVNIVTVQPDKEQLPTSFNIRVCVNNFYYTIKKGIADCFSSCCNIKSKNLLS